MIRPAILAAAAAVTAAATVAAPGLLMGSDASGEVRQSHQIVRDAKGDMPLVEKVADAAPDSALTIEVDHQAGVTTVTRRSVRPSRVMDGMAMADAHMRAAR